MPHLEQEIEVAKKIKKILEQGIQEGPWQANLFLKGIKKKLEEIREQFEVSVGLDHFKWEACNNKDARDAGLDNTRKIYIALYQSQGSNIQKWQQVITSLVRHSTGRPIYKDEDDVKAATYLNDRNPNNAYVVLKVNKDAILPDSFEQPRVDREGRKLIMLKEGAITLHNIVRLVHASGYYKLVGNFLVKQT